MVGEISGRARGAVVGRSLRVHQAEQLLGQDLVVERGELEGRQQGDGLAMRESQRACPAVVVVMFTSHADIEPTSSLVTAQSRWAMGPICGSSRRPDHASSVNLRKDPLPVIIGGSLPHFLWPKGGCSQGTVARNHTNAPVAPDSGLASHASGVHNEELENEHDEGETFHQEDV